MPQGRERAGQHDRAQRAVILAGGHVVGHGRARHDPDMRRRAVEQFGGGKGERPALGLPRRLVKARLDAMRQGRALKLQA